MQLISMTESPGVSRTQRWTLARRVNGTLEHMLARRAFRRLELGSARIGRIIHRIHWHQDCVRRFVLDFDAGAVSIPALTSTTLPRPVLTGVRCLLRLMIANRSGERLRLDPDKAELRVFEKHGSLTLSITVRDDSYEYCTAQLVSLAGTVLGTLREPANALSIDEHSR